MQLLLAKQLGQRRPPLMFYSFSLILLASLLALTALAASSPSYYKILDISPDADARTIKKAYRRLAQKLHPDKHPEKEEEFVKMSDAYQVLSDEELRKVYDRYGEEGVKRHQAGRQGGGANDPFDVFRSFFGGGGGHQQHQVRKGPSKQFNLVVSLQDMYMGKTIMLEYDRKVVCNKCDGSGARSKSDLKTCETCGGRGVRIVTQEIMPGFRTQMQTVCNVCGGTGIHIAHKCDTCSGEKLINVKEELEVVVPPGAEEGAVYSFEGEADEGVETDVETGDVIVRVSSDRSTSLFRRRASHLYLTRSLTLPMALLGFEDSFPHMDGHVVTVHREAVTQPGWTAVVEGEGMPGAGPNGKKGNLYIEYQVVMPSQIEGDLQKVLEKVFKYPAVRGGGATTDTPKHEEL